MAAKSDFVGLRHEAPGTVVGDFFSHELTMKILGMPFNAVPCHPSVATIKQSSGVNA